MSSIVFRPENRQLIEDNVVSLLNSNQLLMNQNTINSPRAVGDAVQTIIENNFGDCLTIGALGWGQIQIANSNRININEKNSRKKWMLQLCDALDIFYPNEICKITERIDHFKKIREYWENQH